MSDFEIEFRDELVGHNTVALGSPQPWKPCWLESAATGPTMAPWARVVVGTLLLASLSCQQGRLMGLTGFVLGFS